MSYKQVVQVAKHRREPLKIDRFVKISERDDRSDLPEAAWKSLLHNNYLQTWKGVMLAKGMTEITLYPMLLHELQPKTIIEIGAFNGGSAIWFADLMEILGVQSHIYSMDIDLSLLDAKAKDDSRIQFFEGDCHDIASAFPPELLSTLPHPWFITEDAHVNSVGILDYFDKHGLRSGDYIIIEDTNPFIWKYDVTDEELWTDDDNRDEESRGDDIIDDIRRWLANHEDEYLVDT